MGRLKNRKHSKIDDLSPEIKSEVESMIISTNFKYSEIVDFIKDSTGQMISQSSVCRYARGLCTSLENVRFAQETLRAVNDEVNRNPDMDTTEGIIRILSHMMLTNIQRLSDDDFENVDPMKLLKQTTDLVRVSAYKKNLDIKNKELSEIGFDTIKNKVFSVMAKENPELCSELMTYLNDKMKEL